MYIEHFAFRVNLRMFRYLENTKTSQKIAPLHVYDNRMIMDLNTH